MAAVEGRGHRGRQMSMLRVLGFRLVTIKIHGRGLSSNDKM